MIGRRQERSENRPAAAAPALRWSLIMGVLSAGRVARRKIVLIACFACSSLDFLSEPKSMTRGYSGLSRVGSPNARSRAARPRRSCTPARSPESPEKRGVDTAT